ncbi:heme biosynthesis protein HemY [Rhodocista pekingensis]|uniref:Heme biosynthesis protein HemY n=1 Tax=Rhodocista pekingensis TaxID=201185 RepID=A0ABW2KUV1_9PROT
MRRAVFFFIKIGLLIALAIWLARNPGSVSIQFQDWMVDMPFWAMLLALAVIIVAAVVLYRVFSFVVGGPAAFARSRQAAKRERGYHALTQGMVAVAAGDREAASRFARKADTLLNEPPLTLLLSAQAAQLAGDDMAARKYFQSMLQRPETEFLGLRGLLTQALKGGDRTEALKLARRAAEIQPKAQWPVLALMELEAKEGHWKQAEEALDRATATKALPQETLRRHRVALLVERARTAVAEGRSKDALALAQRANEQMPSHVPAAVLVATLRAQAGNRKAATRAIEEAWKIAPHPELAEAWGRIEAIFRPGIDPASLVKRYEALVALDPRAAAAYVALGEACLRADQRAQARTHLEKAWTLAPTQHVFRLLTELARHEDADGEAMREWLERSAGLHPDPDPVWVCSACGTPSAGWSAVCPSCRGFDTMEWRAAKPALRLADAAPAAILPAASRPASTAPASTASGTNAAATPDTPAGGLAQEG